MDFIGPFFNFTLQLQLGLTFETEFHILLVLGHDHGEEPGALSAEREHSVRSRGLVERRIAGVQDLDVVSDLKLYGTFEDEVEFLSRVSREMDGLILLIGIVLVSDVVRRRDAVLEVGRHVLKADALLVRYRKSFALAGYDVARKLRGVSLDQGGDINAERDGAAMEDRKRRIQKSILQRNEFRRRNACGGRKLVDCNTLDFAHFLDTRTDLPQIHLAFLFNSNPRPSNPDLSERLTDDALGLTLGPRQRADREDIPFRQEAKPFLEMLGDSVTGDTRLRLDIDGHVGHAVMLGEDNLKLVRHARNLLESILDLTRIEIDAFDDQHIVRTAGDAVDA